MKSSTIVLSLSISIILASAAGAGLYTFNPVLDYGTQADSSTICQKGANQAWFGFDVSSIPDSFTITSASFSAYVRSQYDNAQRSIWYEPDDSWIGSSTNQGNKALTELVATFTDTGYGYKQVVVGLDLSKHDWSNDLADNYISLMVTGPLDGTHLCGEIQLSESGNLPVLSVVAIPAPGAAILCVIGLGFVNLRVRRRKTF